MKNMISVAFMPRTKILHHPLSRRQRARMCATKAAGLSTDGMLPRTDNERGAWNGQHFVLPPGWHLRWHNSASHNGSLSRGLIWIFIRRNPRMWIKSCPCFWHIANFMMSRHSANRRVILFCSAYSLMNRLFSLLKWPTKSWDWRSCIRCFAH